MVFKNTVLRLSDNSGPKKVKCLNIKKNLIGYLADIIVVVIKKKFLRKKKIKKNILNSLIINTKYKKLRKNGVHISFFQNKGLLLNSNFIFLGSNIKNILCREVKKYRK